MNAAELAERLPSIATVRALSRSFAVLDAILSPDGYAKYTFHSGWADGVELASMDNGSGDEYSIVFTAAGAFIRGFDHESPMSPYANEDYTLWPGLVESVPDEFAGVLTEPAFCHVGMTEPFLAATVCLWRLNEDPVWRTGDIEFDDDGAGWMFDLLVEGSPEAYCDYVKDYFEVQLAVADVTAVFEHRPLDEELVRRVNPSTDLGALAGTLDIIGYPYVGGPA
ncbi:hypothetical protein GCM10023085_50250 [Actinomadura viridis]|uniref:Uncharacterized protein n=1 Tax=Actinomadura viridis TaxID=58110 RepID=A0A931DTI3_9ACTN|nr:hypothetical protein [Actinomadura viridis]MBG6092393.1 hypothetical protein [Actinomadura viridis]